MSLYIFSIYFIKLNLKLNAQTRTYLNSWIKNAVYDVVYDVILITPSLNIRIVYQKSSFERFLAEYISETVIPTGQMYIFRRRGRYGEIVEFMN